MSSKEFPFPKLKGEDASTKSSSPPVTFYRQPLQPVLLITHLPDPPQQDVPVGYSPESQPQTQPQQTVPAYRSESRQQFRTQHQASFPASRFDTREQPRGARQQSFVTAYSPASRQQQYLPNPPQTARTPSPVRQEQHLPEPQQTVRPPSPQPYGQPIPTSRPESRRRQHRSDAGQADRARSPDLPPFSETAYLSARRPTGQVSVKTPSKTQRSNLDQQIASSSTERRFVEPERRTFDSERRPVETGRRPVEPARRSAETERRSSDTPRRRTDPIQLSPSKPTSKKNSPSRQIPERERYRATSSGTDSEELQPRLLRSRKPLTNTPRTRSSYADDYEEEDALINSQPSTIRPIPRRGSSGSASDTGRGVRNSKPRGLNFQDARTYMSSGRPVRTGDWEAGQPHQSPRQTQQPQQPQQPVLQSPISPRSKPINSPNVPSTPIRIAIPQRGGSRPPSPPLTPGAAPDMNNRSIGWALFLNSGMKNHLVATLGELIGTTMFLFFAFAGTVVANINSPADQNLTTTPMTNGSKITKLLYVSFSFGFSLMVNVWIFFRISGGLFNPAVTLALLLTGAIGFVRALFLTLAQILGSIAAAGLVIGLFPAPMNVRTTLSKGLSIPQGLFIEVFLTAELVFTILMLAKEKHKATFIAPVGIGLSLFIAELVGVHWTGGSLNPARSIGPCIVTWTWDHEHWIYWVGPLIGSLVAVGFYALIKALEYELANPGQDSDNADLPSPQMAKFTRQEAVRRRLMDAIGYDVVEGRASVEYDHLGKSEMGMMKPGVVYTRDGVGERASAYVASRGRPEPGLYPATGGPAPQFGATTTTRNTGENPYEKGLHPAVRDMEYGSGGASPSMRRQHGKRGVEGESGG